MRFDQSGGYLTILGIEEWDEYDTVFEVWTSGRKHFYRPRQVDSTATAAAEGHPGSHLTDGSYLDYWDADRTVPATIELDLGKRRRAAYLAINQREWSPTYDRETFGRPETSTRIKDYRVSISGDGERWEVVRTGTLPSERGVRMIDIGRQRTRHIRLEILDTWGSPEAPNYFEKVGIDELYVARRYVRARGGGLPYEAEARENTRTRSARRVRCDACSNAMKVELGRRGAALQYSNVDVDADDQYRLVLHYTADGEGALSVRAGGGEAIDVPVSGQGEDLPFQTAIGVPLEEGANRLHFTGAGDVALDRIEVTPAPTEPPETTVTADPPGLTIKPGDSFEVTGTFRLDDADPVQRVTFGPDLPEGWAVEGEPVTAERLESGQTLTGTWTITSPRESDFGVTEIPLVASFEAFGRPFEDRAEVEVQPLPEGWVAIVEGEAPTNTFSGRAGADDCELCSGGEKVRFIGNDPDNYVIVPNIQVDEAGVHTLLIDYTVDGTRSFFLTVNGGAPIEVSITGISWDEPGTASTTIPLQAGTNTIKIHNDEANAPDLDRIRIPLPEEAG
jgi:NPCBM-associated, NEW3 domain of alpha-galactosidase